MKRLKLAILIMSVLLFSACSSPTTSIPYEPDPAPDSELELYKAYKLIESRLDGLATNSEAKRYLADFLDMAETGWQFTCIKEHEVYYLRVTQLRDSHPNTYYYKYYWKEVLWILDEDGSISPDANARRIEADLLHLSNGGFIESNPDYYSPDELNEQVPTHPPTTEPEQTATSTSYATSSDITQEPTQFDHSVVTIFGQIFSKENGTWLLVDGNSAIQIAGDTAGLQKGFYSLTGEYDAATNTLDVTQFDQSEPNYQKVQTVGQLDSNLTPVSVVGLVATTPKEVSNTLASYISITSFKDIPIYPYVVYSMDGFYLVLSDSLVQLPGEFTFLYEGEDYSFTFSSCWIDGTLIKVPQEEIDFSHNWEPGELAGVIIANHIDAFEPLTATVEQINAEPDKYAFYRVSVTGSYLVTTATLDYSDIKAPMGQGILTDMFTDLFSEDMKKRLEIIDPEANTWQLRECQVIGTVIYPTEEILKYLDYSAPLGKSEVLQKVKPTLIVDTIVDEEEEIADISQLNPLGGNPSQYWGKVVRFDAYALGINYPLKTLAETVTGRDIPLNVNLLAVGIADKPVVDSQLVIIGLNNDLIDKQGEIITGKFRFRVAVAHMPEELVSGIPFTDTALFLLSKEELPVEIPTESYSLNVSIDPSGAGQVTLNPPGGNYPSGTVVTLTAIPAPGYVFDHWGGDATGTSLTFRIIIDKIKSVTAYFRRIL